MALYVARMIPAGCLACVLLGLAEGRDLFVDRLGGDDAASGLSETAAGAHGPVKTIKRAVDLAQPGDTIHLAKAVYAEQVGFYGNKSGEPGKPITVDGHDATISGCVPLDTNQWKEMAPGLYAAEAEELFKAAMRPKDLKNLEWIDAWVGRFSFVFNGKLNRMNHSVKAPAVPWKAPADLQPGEWTYQEPASHLFGRYYIRIDPAKTLADCEIEMPVMVSGVQVAGTISHLVFQNLTVTHVCNDGFALTPGNEPGSKVRDIVYRNIRSVECCDDGLSAHADCEVRIDGFEADDCSTGIASSGTSSNRHVVLRNIHGKDLVFGGGCHVVQDSHIAAHGRSAAVQLWSIWYPDIPDLASNFLKLENVLLTGVQGEPGVPNQIQVGDARSRLELDRCTVSGLSLVARQQGNLKVTDSVVAGVSMDIESNANWQADRNLYDLEHIRIGAVSYLAQDVAAYRKATGQDAASQWQELDPERLRDPQQAWQIQGAAVGADLSRIPGAGRPTRANAERK